jgi:hypothetical protein
VQADIQELVDAAMSEGGGAVWISDGSGDTYETPYPGG